jgi:hypothetical protein
MSAQSNKNEKRKELFSKVKKGRRVGVGVARLILIVTMLSES